MGMRRRKDCGCWRRRQRRNPGFLAVVVVVGFFFLVNWWMVSRMQHESSAPRKDHDVSLSSKLTASLKQPFPEKQIHYEKIGRPRRIMYTRLLALAAHALADGDGKPEPRDLWKETLVPSIIWKPCADQRSWEPSDGTNGFILISANGGISQQRVAVRIYLGT